MAPAVSHLDDVPPVREAVGHLDAQWQDLAAAAGSVRVGLQRIRIAPGRWSTPAHVHDGEEELFHVLAGAGVSWQDGATFAVTAGDSLLHRSRGPAHTLCAGPDGLDVLAFGTRVAKGTSVLPRAGVSWIGVGRWVETAGAPDPYAREAELGPPPRPPATLPRPTEIVHLDDVPVRHVSQGTVQRTERDVGRALGSVTTGLRHWIVPPGQLACPPHVHSASDEIFHVLAGDGHLLLGDDAHPVRAGSTVARPAGTGVAHAFRAGAGGLTYLCHGTRRPEDVCWYPRSGKLAFHGLGVIARVETVGFWDGEP